MSILEEASTSRLSSGFPPGGATRPSHVGFNRMTRTATMPQADSASIADHTEAHVRRPASAAYHIQLAAHARHMSTRGPAES